MDLVVTNPILSVVIPTRNRAHLVGEAIESALNQRPGQVEVIVVDDGSTDDTAKVITETFGSRIRLLRTPERRGAGAARNAGLRVARGEFIAFLDDDDLWLQGKLEAELKALERFPDADGIVSDSLTFVQGQVAPQSFFMKNGLLAATQGHVRWINELPWLWTNSLNGVAMCSITVRRRVLDQRGDKWFAEDLISCEDWELEMWVYHHWRIVALPEVFAWIRRLDDGARVNRSTPGKPPTSEQEFLYLRDRLTVIERSHWPRGLRADLAAELENCREDTVRRLAQLENAETA